MTDATRHTDLAGGGATVERHTALATVNNVGPRQFVEFDGLVPLR
jgi:hypothetical protein